MTKLKIPKRENGVTVFFFQLCVVGNNVFGSDAQLYIVSKLLTLAFFGVVLLRIIYKGKVKVNQILLVPVLFTIYCAATAFWAYNTDRVLSQMVTQVQLLVLLLCAFWAMNDGVTLLDYLKALYVSGFGLAIFALVRYGGLDPYIRVMLDGTRMGGEIANENTFGMVFSSAALSTAYYFVLKKKRIHIISFAVFVFFAFSSGSRKAMLILLAGVVGIALIHYGIRRIYQTLIWGTVVLVAVYFMLQIPYFSSVWRRIERTISGEQASTDRARWEMIEYGLELFWKRPIFGFGLNNFRELYRLGLYSHNNYIELLSGGGLIALFLYYAMFFIPAAELLLSRKKGEKLSDLHLMFWVWQITELIYAFGVVQMYNKNSWLLAGVLMAEAAQVASRKQILQENDRYAA